MDSQTLFEIIYDSQKEQNEKFVYEDDYVFAIEDINPQAPVHFLLIPQQHDGLTQLSKAEDKHREILGRLMVAVGKISRSTPELKDGFRLVINDGANGLQSVYHLHLHIIGGETLKWPPGCPNGQASENPKTQRPEDIGKKTLFQKMINKEIGCSVFYEDEDIFAINDINPQSQVHILFIPKNKDVLTELGNAQDKNIEILGQLMVCIGQKGREKPELKDGFRVVVNSGPCSCQTVYHLHIHLIGGEKLTWPPGTSKGTGVEGTSVDHK